MGTGVSHAQDRPAPNSIENFNLSTGGTGLYRPGKWGLIKVGVRNPQDHDVDLLATTYFVGDPTLQFGRRLWIPPKSRLSSWHPIRMPALESRDQKLFELRSMVITNTAGGESMATNEFGSMQFDQSFRVAANEPVTAMVADLGSPQAFNSPWSTPQDLVLTGRNDRGLKYNYVLLADPLFPAGEELLESVDQLVIASDRLTADVGGIAAIRRWVASGGRLWIMADRVSPGMVASLLGDEDTFLEVDRVDLSNVHVDTGVWSQTQMPFDRELERPVRFVRVIAENVDVDFLVNGWPAAFWKTYGEGRILITTLGSDGWLSPRTKSASSNSETKAFETQFVPGAPLSQLALDFFTPHSPPLLPRELAENQVREMIGYSIPARSLVVGTLGGFTLLLLVLAVFLGRRGRLELMGLAVPALSLLAAGVLMAAGWNNRSTIPASVAMIQVVQGVPGTDEVRTSGLAGVFSKDSQPSKLTGTSGGWMTPEMHGLEGTTRRMVWSDIDTWSWQNLPANPGLVVGTLGGFTLLLLVLAVFLGRRGRLELMGLAVPALSLLAAGVLMAAGWNNRSTIPASVAMIQVVQGVPGTDEVRTSGLAGVFSKDSQPSKLTGTSGGWMTPEMHGLEGTTRRMVWSDIDTWSWQNLPANPGLRTVEFQTAGQVAQAVEAVAEFDTRGIHGKLVLPPGLDPGDAVIATAQGRLGVELQSDGKFTAVSTGVLGSEQYLSASVLSDQQQQRSQLMSQMLKPAPGTSHAAVPLLLVWTKPWQAGMSLIQPNTVGSALVSVPLRWERPAAGTSVSIPAPFLPFREVTSPDGTPPAGIYDYRKGTWQPRTGSSTTWLGFSVPTHLRPLDVKSATVIFKVLGPMGRLAISAEVDNHRQELKEWDNPVGTLRYDITDRQALKLDSRGRILLRMDIGESARTSDIGVNSPKSPGGMAPATYWQFEDISLQVLAEVGKHVE